MATSRCLPPKQHTGVGMENVQVADRSYLLVLYDCNSSVVIGVLVTEAIQQVYRIHEWNIDM